LDDDYDGSLDSVENAAWTVLLAPTNTGTKGEIVVPSGWTIANSTPDIGDVNSSGYSISWSDGCTGVAPAAPNGHTQFVFMGSPTQESFKTRVENWIVGKTYQLTYYQANFGINHVGANKLAPSIGYTNGTREYNDKVTNFIITNDVIFNAVLVYNSSENKIYWYINGQLDSSYTLSATPKSTNYPICLGRWDGGYGDYYFNGRVYSGNIHNRALTAQEIQQNYNATRGRYGI
jgi:hypothetical protein